VHVHTYKHTQTHTLRSVERQEHARRAAIEGGTIRCAALLSHAFALSVPFVCVRERETDRQRERGGEREREGERETERERARERVYELHR